MASTRTEMYDKLLAQEGESLDRAAGELSGECACPADFLSATCTILNRRQRYFSMAGEHGSAFDLEGINFVDALDERLLGAVDRVMAARKAGELPPDAAKRLTGVLTNLPTLPPHPVAYMVIHLMTKAFSGFEAGMRETGEAIPQELEQALLERMAGWIGGFLHTRRTPVLRHMSDVSREYSVVARLACACGKNGLTVQRQALRALPGGGQADSISARCPSCGAEREIEFALPHFGDLARIVGEGSGGKTP